MDDSDLTEQLIELFELEAAEHVQALNAGLLRLESGEGDARDEIVRELFRAAHSLKGAARAVDLPDVEHVAHDLESLFAELQGEGAVLSGDALQRALGIVDDIEALVRAARLARAPKATASAGDGSALVSVHGPVAPAPDETIRVATRKLDALMAQVGELAVARLSLDQRLTELRELETVVGRWRKATHPRESVATGPDSRTSTDVVASLADPTKRVAALRVALESDVRRVASLGAELEADVRQTRLQPIGKILDAFPRMIRDLARETGKEATLVIRGSGTELDRSVLEHVKDALLHLLRNAVEHGVEPPEERSRARKPRQATITVAASRRGDHVEIVVEDDGAGIDVERVRARAVDAGLIEEDAGPEPDAHLDLIFRQGLSTSASVTELAGRGVGLDAVRAIVEGLRGRVSVRTLRGQGTTFTVAIPLAVSTVEALLVRVGAQRFGLPVGAVEQIIRVEPSDVTSAQGRDTISIGGEPVVVVPLAAVLDVEHDAGPPQAQGAVLVATTDRRAAFLVDVLERTVELVVKPLPEVVARSRLASGAAILGSGDVAIVLNAAELVAVAGTGSLRAAAGAGAVPRAPRLLLVEDSVTTRTLERNILQGAGYDVAVAADGLQAWDLLTSSDVDLVVSDVEMPGMDGFTLVARMRADVRFRDVPVVLVTSRDAPADRERGSAVGADAYIVKGAFDQQRLLDAIRELL